MPWAATTALPGVLYLFEMRVKTMTQKEKGSDDAAAMREGRKPGPKDAPVQVRNAGPEAMKDRPRKWDEVDEASDESFPASDSSAKY